MAITSVQRWSKRWRIEMTLVDESPALDVAAGEAASKGYAASAQEIGHFGGESWLGAPHAQHLTAEVTGEVNPIMLRLVSRVRWLSDEVESVRASLSGPRSA